HRATGDHAGTLGSRLHEHACGAVAGLDRVPQGGAVELDVAHVLAGVLHRLLDRDRDLAGLAVTEADLAGAVTHHRQRGEGELAAALDRLADAVDRDQLLDHAVILLFAIAIATPRGTFFCHVSSLCGLGCLRLGRLSLWMTSGAPRRGQSPVASGASRAGSVVDQNCRPPSRAASARALMRPW